MNITKRPVAQKTKKNRCKVCKQLFSQLKPLQVVCSIECSKTHANALRAKKELKEYKDAKEKQKSRNDWIREAQHAFNAYIRERDKGLPCICCELPTKDGDHAGHWKPTSSSPELRFNEDNVHLQRLQCNVFLHGNVANYRIGLIRRIGLDRVEQLEAKHEPKKWSIEELKSIKSEYKQKLKALVSRGSDRVLR